MLRGTARTIIVLLAILGLCFSFGSMAFSQEAGQDWVKTGSLNSKHANQAAAAGGRFVYAINNHTVAKCDRKGGELIATSTGDAHHLNSGFFYDGKLYCAHSNYPQKPEVSVIKVLDVESMRLSDFHSFGHSPHGSLTVALLEDGAWWCVFAVYGKENNSRTALVKFDEDWKEVGVWKFPASVVADLGSSSISGGIWKDGLLLATGHDKKVIYQLKLPESGAELVHISTAASPFPGQGIAEDPVTGGLIGINRQQRQIVFAERQK